MKGRIRSLSRCGDCLDDTPSVRNSAQGKSGDLENVFLDFLPGGVMDRSSIGSVAGLFPSAVMLLIFLAIRKLDFPGSTWKIWLF